MVISRLAAGLSVMIYPGFFLVWIVKMALFPHSQAVLVVFLLTVIANDSTAWAVGMLFGRRNRGIVQVSPYKSTAGFIGGCVASILICAGAVYWAPEAFKPARFLSPLAAGILLGILSSIAVILGDLAESALKRSADIKDSGVLIPGRGGVLDSVDSIALTAPVFYVFYRFFF
jgi:phosphatidate cytidylyltransferase